MKHELTEWYPGHVKPVRDGVYQRKYGDVVFFCKYQNGRWRSGDDSPKDANVMPYFSPWQTLPWRGIKK